MAETVLYSSVKLLVDSLGKGMPHDEGILLQLQIYLDTPECFLMSAETVDLIIATLGANSGVV